jgi:hypothetical protein
LVLVEKLALMSFLALYAMHCWSLDILDSFSLDLFRIFDVGFQILFDFWCLNNLLVNVFGLRIIKKDYYLLNEL